MSSPSLFSVMSRRFYCRRSVLVLSCILLGVGLFVRCVNNGLKPAEAPASPVSGEYSGTASCASCHKNILDSFLHTPHYLTSMPATAESIQGSFSPGKNMFLFNPGSAIAMETRNGNFYQVEYENGVEKKSRKFDITVGSGTKGQTYLYWWKDTLFQLPMTYFTALDQWCNSPGYAGKVAFGRPVTARCLECHSTYARAVSAPGAQFEKFDHHILFGVGCEKCHGPGAKHVQYEKDHPADKKAFLIRNPATYSRQQSLDLCALCHGGRLTATSPAFSFQSGDTLVHFFSRDTSAKDAADIDVHGNQYGLLKASKCFRLSQMTCLSCHNPHEKETGKIALFSQRCLGCHQPRSGHDCTLSTVSTARKEQNCIDCHMPIQSSRSIMVLLQGQSIPVSASMRSHYIKVYPEETKKITQALKNISH